MKKINFLIAAAMVAAFVIVASPATAQVSKEEKQTAKANDQHQKDVAKALYSKDPKQAQKEAKKLEREGWKTMGLPIAKQLDNTWMKMMDEDPMTGYNRFIWTTQTALGKTFATAQMQVENVGKVRIAGQIQTTVMSEAKTELANQQLDPKDAAAFDKALEKATLMVAQKLGRMVKTEELFRVVNNNYEMRCVMFYDMKSIMDMVKADAVKDLKQSLDEWDPTYEKIIDDIIDTSWQKVNNN